MTKKYQDNTMTIIDAVDNLSGMAELDLEHEKESEVQGVKHKLSRLKNLHPDEQEKTLSVVKGTFKTIHQYLERIYHKEKGQLKDKDMQRGIKAIMVLADEAADKLSTCTSLFNHTYKEGKLSEIKEYKELRQFYMNKIVKRFQEVLESEAAWEEEWGSDIENIDIEKIGLKDLETVKRDKEYELFYIRKDDGKPFFNRNLLRHIKLVSDFDEVITGVEGEDPLLQINLLLDREAQGVAENIREDVKNELGDFFADALQHKEVPIVGDVIKLTMSLMLACNPQNLIHHTMGKMCVRYLKDFHQFLRKVLASEEYKRLVSHSIEETDQLSRTLIHLIHAYAYAYFTRMGNYKEFHAYYQNLLEKSQEGKPFTQEGNSETLTFFSDTLDHHDHITHFLKRYPNGPLFKTLDIFREREQEEGFDPIMQGNSPYELFHFTCYAFDAKCLKIPCPTFHSHINKAEVIEEFKGFLRHIETKKNLKKHLLINLQDRTSWEEHARCQTLEDLEKQAEFNQGLVVVTLPKKSDFYFQTDTYLEVDCAEDFLKLVEEQVMSGEACGFHFSQKVHQKDLKQFVKKILPLIHTHFFGKKENLERRERLDFIEIFYMFLCLKILDLTKPDSFSFSCKDGVDVGATTSAGFLAILKALSKNIKWKAEEQGHFMWVLHGAALTVRERLVSYDRLSRTLSAMGVLSEAFTQNKGALTKELELLFDCSLFQDIGYTF